MGAKYILMLKQMVRIVTITLKTGIVLSGARKIHFNVKTDGTYSYHYS